MLGFLTKDENVTKLAYMICFCWYKHITLTRFSQKCHSTFMCMLSTYTQFLVYFKRNSIFSMSCFQVGRYNILWRTMQSLYGILNALSTTLRANLVICQQGFPARFVKYRVHSFPNWCKESSGRFYLACDLCTRPLGISKHPNNKYSRNLWNTCLWFSSLHAEQMRFHEW